MAPGGGFGGGGFGGFGGGEQVVIVQPSGIYQPIFSVRRVVTDVSIYDGATVVIGGLTREEVKTVKDMVPILGKHPILWPSIPFRGGVLHETEPHHLCYRKHN